MNVINDIGIFRDAVDPALCEEIMERFDEKEAKALEQLGPGVFLEDVSIDGVVFRKCRKRWDSSIMMENHSSMDPLRKLIEKSIMTCLDEYMDHYKAGAHSVPEVTAYLDPMEVKIQKAGPGGGFYQWHYEQGPGPSAGRYGVWMLYLNTVEKGGKTEFSYQNVQVQPEQGTMVLWPAGFTHRHRSAPDLEEQKYIATGWLYYNPEED